MSPVIKMPDGSTAIVCVRGGKKPALCDYCAKLHSKLCDWPMDDKGTKTCDKKLCDDHAHNVGPDRDYCPEHHQVILAQGKPNA